MDCISVSVKNWSGHHLELSCQTIAAFCWLLQARIPNGRHVSHSTPTSNRQKDLHHIGLEVGFYNMINMNKQSLFVVTAVKTKQKKRREQQLIILRVAIHPVGVFSLPITWPTSTAAEQTSFFFFLHHPSVREQTWFLCQNEKARLFYF